MFIYSCLKKDIDFLAAIITVPKELIPKIGIKNSAAHPYIEYIFPFYYLVVNDNGIEFKRQRFFRRKMLQYNVFKGITFKMAIQYELCHRNVNQDSRRVIFTRPLELMRKLSLKWWKMCANEIDVILLKHPYNDNLQ